MELEKIIPVSNDIVEFIRPHCTRAEVAGSIRRMKSEVKDVEIVAIVNDWQKLFESLSAFGYFIKPGVPDIEPWAPKENAKYLRMMLDCGLKLDLFIASPENWGGLFMMRTGAGVSPDGKPFNAFVPSMFSRWKQLSGGGKMSNCMPTFPDGRSVVVREEEDFFKLLGVNWIEPRDRVSRSAIKKIPGYVLNLSSFEIR